jgi:tRNA-splicing ligase RtcB
METFIERQLKAPYRIYGTGHEASAVDQLENACRLPVTLYGAGMPDLQTGYGLPIGGVIAVDNAVIPYAVGKDIACRMRLTLYDVDAPEQFIHECHDRLVCILEEETRFGLGAHYADFERKDHRVMYDHRWESSELLMDCKDTAWSQLGSSGAGNHFAEFGFIDIFQRQNPGFPTGRWLALLTHGGSRNTGSKICDEYSRIAKNNIVDLPKELQDLAWLSLDSVYGTEYWTAMELMGFYAQANHQIIHDAITARLGFDVVAWIENHHNFAWKEDKILKDRVAIVHRKGATPAHKGVYGIIPGTMNTPAYLVQGKGNPASMFSASHGAGRAMSCKKAKATFTMEEMTRILAEAHVTLISGSLDEISSGYKDIETVMAAQSDLVVGKFTPRIVKMALEKKRAWE